MRALKGREIVWRSVLACPEGLEPPTYCLEGNCSIRLSYGQMMQVCGASVDVRARSAGSYRRPERSRTSLRNP